MRTAAGAVGGAGGEGGERDATRRCALRDARLLSLAARRHDNLVVDFAPGALDEIVAEADVVIEASRPSALRRLGLRAEEFLAARPGRVWVGITGYGRENDRIAFGDDAAVAGGLTGVDPNGDPVFLGDALADPVTGVFAAHAAARSLAAGGGELLCVSMAACAATLTDARTRVHPPC
ncbi:CoA transferase [Streptomyces sp. NPDC048504]|uniref:CoA transferase n=1 Tax=Streptomyces sp. NPDC048504 TaxID=3365559 RepID=UPI0037219595